MATASSAGRHATTKRRRRPACDACHVRRVKCSHDQPCSHCARLSLTCTYTKLETGRTIENVERSEQLGHMYEWILTQPTHQTQVTTTNFGQSAQANITGELAVGAPPFHELALDTQPVHLATEDVILSGIENPAMQTLQSDTDLSMITAMGALHGELFPPLQTSFNPSLFSEQDLFNPMGPLGDTSIPTPASMDSEQKAALSLLDAWLQSSGQQGVDAAGTGENHAADEENHMDDAQEHHPLSDSVLIPTLMLFYERLGSVMPVFSREWIFERLDCDEYRRDGHFASMLVAMSALTLIQVQKNPYKKAAVGSTESQSTSASKTRQAKAILLLDEALKLRDGPLSEHRISLDGCFTSFFVAISLFEMGETSSAWFRLRESITIAQLIQLHKPSTYTKLSDDDAQRRLRAYWLLVITERACAIQSAMPIALTGHPQSRMSPVRQRFSDEAFDDFPEWQLRLFDGVDERFVDCWNRDCEGQTCQSFDKDRVISLWQRFTDQTHRTRDNETTSSTSYHRKVQLADVEVTRHWLLNRLWLITLNHGLLQTDAREPPLRYDHSIYVAQSIANTCHDMTAAAMEALGVGVAYKLYDIAQMLATCCKSPSLVQMIGRGSAERFGDKNDQAVHMRERFNWSSTFVNEHDQDEQDVSVRVTHAIRAIFQEYLVVCQRLRGGDHPYAEKMAKLIDEL